LKRLAVFTKDEYLYRKISLSLLESFECEHGGNVRLADFVIWDIDSMGKPSRADFITVSREKDADISRPFAVSSLKERLTEAKDSLPFTVDTVDKTVNIGGERVLLTDIEFSLLYALYKRRGEYASRDELNFEVWGRKDDGTLLNVYVHYLRQKLEICGKKLIISSRKHGYKIDKRYFEGGMAE
jgi:hypothetical protein